MVFIKIKNSLLINGQNIAVYSGEAKEGTFYIYQGISRCTNFLKKGEKMKSEF